MKINTFGTPKLSVIIPTWNRAKYICKAIDSALLQGTEGEIEVIVIDDCSTDNTTRLLTKRYGEKIKYQRLENRSGVSKARNVGVNMASGEFLGFLDSDDYYLPGKFSLEQAQFKQFPNTHIVISDSQPHIEEQPRDFTRFELVKLKTPAAAPPFNLADCDWLWTKCANSMSICSITFKRQLIGELGLPLFAEDLISCEDWELELHLYPNRNIRVLPQVLSHVHAYPDETRVTRGMNGKQPSLEQRFLLLRNRHTVMARNKLPNGVAMELQAEYQYQFKKTQLEIQETQKKLKDLTDLAPDQGNSQCAYI